MNASRTRRRIGLPAAQKAPKEWETTPSKSGKKITPGDFYEAFKDASAVEVQDSILGSSTRAQASKPMDFDSILRTQQRLLKIQEKAQRTEQNLVAAAGETSDYCKKIVIGGCKMDPERILDYILQQGEQLELLTDELYQQLVYVDNLTFLSEKHVQRDGEFAGTFDEKQWDFFREQNNRLRDFEVDARKQFEGLEYIRDFLRLQLTMKQEQLAQYGPHLGEIAELLKLHIWRTDLLMQLWQEPRPYNAENPDNLPPLTTSMIPKRPNPPGAGASGAGAAGGNAGQMDFHYM